MSNKMFTILGSAVLAATLTISAPVGISQAAETKRPAATANILGIPLKVGKVQISCPFLKVNATITHASKDRIVFASNYKNVTINADTSRPGGINLAFGDDKMKGSVEKGVNQAVLALDNIGRFTIQMAESDHYVISGALPFNIHVNFVN